MCEYVRVCEWYSWPWCDGGNGDCNGGFNGMILVEQWAI